MNRLSRIKSNNNLIGDQLGYFVQAWVVIMAVFLLPTFTLNAQVTNAQAPTVQAPNQGANVRTLDREEQANVNVFKQSSPSVVNISTRKAIAARGESVSLNMARIQSGTGSGFLWDSNGHVVTNFHVIDDSDSVRVRLTDGSEWAAEILGTAPEFDLAVLKIEAPARQLRPLAVGRSDSRSVKKFMPLETHSDWTKH